MCRMIAAVGRLEPEALKDALRAMALNENPAYEHEHRDRGEELRHDCGWGAAFVTQEGVTTRRSTRPCFDDPEFDSLSFEGVEAAVLHARRNRDRSTIAIENTHPFQATWSSVPHAFFHNGEVKDRAQLSYDASLVPKGTADSEELFFHVLTRLEPSEPLSSLEACLAQIHDFTSLNCFLMIGRSLFGYARMRQGSEYPRYYTLWRGASGSSEVVSSEVVDGLGVEWCEVTQGTAFRIPSSRREAG